MSIDIQQVAEFWSKDEPLYAELGKAIEIFIRAEITKYEILPQISHRTKELVSIIKKIKKKQQEKEYSYWSLNDKLGIRLICSFQDEMELVDNFLNDNFEVIKVEYKRESLDFDKLDYISNHYDAKIKSSHASFRKLKNHSNLIFEIQVRTLNQHSWSNASHALSYKSDIELSGSLKRRLYRLLSLYEIADDEISALNRILLRDPDLKHLTMLKKLEGKFFRFAKRDYDREISIYSLKKIRKYFSEDEFDSVLSSIIPFINEHDSKIESIFNENEVRLFEVPFLSQPEILLIWYALEKHFFNIDDNWDNDFPREELEQIQQLWGKEID